MKSLLRQPTRGGVGVGGWVGCGVGWGGWVGWGGIFILPTVPRPGSSSPDKRSIIKLAAQCSPYSDSLLGNEVGGENLTGNLGQLPLSNTTSCRHSSPISISLQDFHCIFPKHRSSSSTSDRRASWVVGMGDGQVQFPSHALTAVRPASASCLRAGPRRWKRGR